MAAEQIEDPRTFAYKKSEGWVSIPADSYSG